MMASKKPGLFDWNRLDTSEKLGWVWLGLFFILILATALTILVPAWQKWRAEVEEEEKGSSLPLPSETFYASATAKDFANGIVGIDKGAGETRRVSLPTGLG